MLFYGLNCHGYNFTMVIYNDRNRTFQQFIFIFLILFFFGGMVACNPNDFAVVESKSEETQQYNSTVATPMIPPKINEQPTAKISKPFPPIWAEKDIPSEAMDLLGISKDNIHNTKKNSVIILQVENVEEGLIVFQKVFFVGVMLTDMRESISFQDLHKLWKSTDETKEIIWIAPDDRPYLEHIFGPVSKMVKVRTQQPEECNSNQCLRILTMNNIEPEWRVIPVDGIDPFETYFDLKAYPLGFMISAVAQGDLNIEQVWSESGLELYNDFDRNKFASVMMTGTTALVRGTAFQMEKNGVLFPSEHIGDLLQSADITHISNEVPFYTACPAAVPLRKEMRFCSSPAYIELFSELDIDVIELSGNHLLDWGPEAFEETLILYEKYGLPYYAGGKNVDEAEQPLIMERQGNRFVFIGCNVAGPDNNWATDTRPGAARCDMEKIINQISQYKEDGYLPIVTFQHHEVDDFIPIKLLREDFWAAAHAGAVVVSGSQAHFPQGFDLVDGNFIDYGVGNLFFDQMDNWYRKATIDIHYFYGGRYINTRLIPIINEEYGQPRIMTEIEKEKFFTKLFANSFLYAEMNQ
ncbi:MAG: hypothetical protein CVU39_03850 [Chloroflexi bacterium HGW-Chloroflexi-10]|nr:MAG: hypothetical protein CVU39_03850 [Chloroflexi bacterium HGW-Chloroflexi-10]